MVRNERERNQQTVARCLTTTVLKVTSYKSVCNKQNNSFATDEDRCSPNVLPLLITAMEKPLPLLKFVSSCVSACRYTHRHTDRHTDTQTDTQTHA